MTTAKPKASVPAAVAPIDRPPPISGTHGAAIDIFAVSSEGDAVVSADTRGGIRMWPALDGSREPVVLHAQQPSSFAIAHDGDGWLVANVDVSKGLELIRMDHEGRVRGRVMTRGEAVDDVVLIDRAAFVLRADQTIEVLDASGVRTAELVPDAGTRVSRLLVAGTRALAIGTRESKTFVRWIEPGARWGATIQVPGIAASRLAVSPDRAYLVSSQLGVSRTFDLVTGKQGPVVCGLTQTARSIALGFIDADTVACINDGTLVWWSMSMKRTVGIESKTPQLDEERDLVASGVVVSRFDHELVLRRRDGAKQLGYATSANMIVRFSPGGITIAGVRRSLVVDATLRARATVEHPLDEGLLAIGDGYAIGISTPEVSVNDAWGESHALSVFDLARGETHQKLAVRTSDALAFEPVTGWLATIDGAITQLLRYDAKTHMFGAPVALEAEGVIHRIMLLDPALSNGVAAMTIEKRVSSSIIGEIDARDLGGARVKTRRTYRVAGDLLAIDRTGRVYANDPHGHLRVSKGDAAARELPITGALSVVPDADGSRLAVVTRGEIALYLADGTHVWSTAARDVRQVRWLGTDLVAGFADSLARFDLTTGELAARQCGWDFGLHEIKLSGGADAPNVCDAD